ncbi:MAG: tetratricopeptide repeat protein [Bdellovibrionales bacterium]
MNPEFIERYQLAYQQDPNSKIFAPLAEAYRKMGLLEEAHRICEIGVKKHPHFPSGRVALAKILIEKKMYPLAIEQLKVAVELSPENILGHSLLGECYLQVREMKSALKAFKMVLFLNPTDEKASHSVQKLESLTADEYEEDAFAMKKLPEAVESLTPEVTEEFSSAPFLLDALTTQRILDRYLSLTDAYIVRNDSESALNVLQKATNELGPHPEVEKRRKLLLSRLQASQVTVQPVDLEEIAQQRTHENRLQMLQRLLTRVEERRIT